MKNFGTSETMQTLMRKSVCALLSLLLLLSAVLPVKAAAMQGFRLGFGKGYYDRFLQNFSGTSVGLCYSKCIEHTLPSGVFDRPVDAVITEKYTNRTNNEFVKE